MWISEKYLTESNQWKFLLIWLSDTLLTDLNLEKNEKLEERKWHKLNWKTSLKVIKSHAFMIWEFRDPSTGKHNYIVCILQFSEDVLR